MEGGGSGGGGANLHEVVDDGAGMDGELSAPRLHLARLAAPPVLDKLPPHGGSRRRGVGGGLHARTGAVGGVTAGEARVDDQVERVDDGTEGRHESRVVGEYLCVAVAPRDREQQVECLQHVLRLRAAQELCVLLQAAQHHAAVRWTFHAYSTPPNLHLHCTAVPRTFCEYSMLLRLTVQCSATEP